MWLLFSLSFLNTCPPSLSCKLLTQLIPLWLSSLLAAFTLLFSLLVTSECFGLGRHIQNNTPRIPLHYFTCVIYLFRLCVVLPAFIFPPPLLLRHPLLYLLWVFWEVGGVVDRIFFIFFLRGLITSYVLCIAPPAPPPSGPPSTLTPGGSSTLSKKRPPPPPPGHKRTLSDPPSPLSHSPHSKGGLTGGEMQAHLTVWPGFSQAWLQPDARISSFSENVQKLKRR